MDRGEGPKYVWPEALKLIVVRGDYGNKQPKREQAQEAWVSDPDPLGSWYRVTDSCFMQGPIPLRFTEKLKGDHRRQGFG